MNEISVLVLVILKRGNVDIVDKNKKRVETFEFENADFDACNKLWKMLSK
jgi:hypothetical protein